MPIAHLTLVDTPVVTYLSLAMRRAFEMAMEERSALPEPVFRVQGYSGRKFRMFLNNLFSFLESPRYLEIGVFNGGSFIPSIYNNRMKAVALDNWSWGEHGASIDKFKAYLLEFGGIASVDIWVKDFNDVDFGKIVEKFNVMFYDGDHAFDSQYAGVLKSSLIMDKSYILIVDDWNWHWVRIATMKAIRDIGGIINNAIEIRTMLQNEGMPPFHGQDSEWHNGMFAAVITKAS